MVTVIIPVYNGEKTLGALLDSLNSQCDTPSEIIVVDDGSTDRSREIALSKGAKLLSTGGRRGPACARNIGAKFAQGDVLLFLDADTLAPPNLLRHVAERFEKEPTLTAIVGYYDKKPLNDGFFPRYKALLVNYWFKGAVVMESFETCCGAIRKEIFEKAGGFDENYDRADVEDYEFGYRLLKMGKIMVDHEMIVGHHFPTFTRNWLNYYRRAKLWTKLFLNRKEFESTATTPTEGLSRLSAVAFSFSLLLSLFISPFGYVSLFFLLTYLLLAGKFFLYLYKEEGLYFALLGVLTHIASSYAVVCGVVWGIIESVIEKKSFQKKETLS